MKITAGANAWRKVIGVMGDRRISRKRNMLSSCYPGIQECIRDDGINRETTGKCPELRKLVRSTWADHVEKMAEEKLAGSTCP